MLDLTPGTILENRYEILHSLGRGGMGTVYLAEDSRLNRQCAVKMALRTDPEAEAQFRREAGFLANLHHNNLPRVIDYFAQGDRYFLVMDYVQGRDFGQIVQQEGPQPESEVLQWLPQILDALEYLHGQKPKPVIHRDIKPANVKLTPSGRVMLVDFSIAKQYDPQISTVAGARAFSPGFSPPEQYGQGRTDARSDIFSLGATLYYLLTGVVPVDAADRMIGVAELVPPRQHNPQISPATEAATLKAMALNPDKRFASVQELREALAAERTLAPQVASAVPRSPAPSRGFPALAVIRFAVAVVVILGVAGILFMRGREAPPASTIPPTTDAPARPTASPAGLLPGAEGSPTSNSPALAATATLRPTFTAAPAAGILVPSIIPTSAMSTATATSTKEAPAPPGGGNTPPLFPTTGNPSPPPISTP